MIYTYSNPVWAILMFLENILFGCGVPFIEFTVKLYLLVFRSFHIYIPK